jgi:hypothetical protein
MDIIIDKTLMNILIWIMQILDALMDIFRVLAGLDNVQRNNPAEPDVNLVNFFLGQSIIQQVFVSIILISFGICAGCMIFRILFNMFTFDPQKRKPNSRIIGQGFSIIFVTVIVASLMISGIAVANTVLRQIDRSFNNDGTKISTRIFDLSVSSYTEVRVFYWNDADGTGQRLERADIPNVESLSVNTYGHLVNDSDAVLWWFLDRDGDVEIERKGEGWLNGGGEGQFDAATMNADDVYGVWRRTIIIPLWEDSNRGQSRPGFIRLGSFNFGVAYLATIVVLVAVIMSILGLTKRLYDLVLLFLALPLMMSTVPLDDGARFKLWRDAVIGKVLLAYGAVFAINIFLVMLPLIDGLNLVATFGSSQTANVFTAILIMGGALSISSGQLLISRIFGTGAEESREMAQSAQTLIAGAGTAGAIAVGTSRIITKPMSATSRMFSGKNSNKWPSSGGSDATSGVADLAGGDNSFRKTSSGAVASSSAASPFTGSKSFRAGQSSSSGYITRSALSMSSIPAQTASVSQSMRSSAPSVISAPSVKPSKAEAQRAVIKKHTSAPMSISQRTGLLKPTNDSNRGGV